MTATAEPYTPALHDRWIEFWRNGQVTAAQLLAQFTLWLAAVTDPAQRQRLLSDRVAIAAEAGQAAQAVAWAREAPVDQLSAYALEAVIPAARAVGAGDLQAAAERRWLELEPGNWDARLQEAQVMVDRHQFSQAQARLDLLALSAQQIPARQMALLEVRAALAEASDDPLGALSHYQAMLAIDPANRPARRKLIFLMARWGSGALEPATTTTLRDGGQELFSPLERAALEQEALAWRLRWALIWRNSHDDATRLGPLDEVLVEFERLDARLAAQAAPERVAADEDAWRAIRARLAADHVQALVERGRLADAIERYRRLEALQPGTPYYAKAAVASAYARLGQPQRAVPLYEAALREAGDQLRMPSDIHIDLVYAYLDTGQFSQADALLAQLIASTPPFLRLSPVRGTPNTDYGDLLGLSGLVDLYSDRLARAQRKFDALVALAPLNQAYRVGQANMLRARQHPEAAVARLQDFLAVQPDSISAQAAYAEALFDAGQYGPARQLVDRLEQTYPDSGAVRSAVRTRNSAMAARLDVDADVAKEGGTLANREWRLNARLSSGWFNDRWRLFYHQVLARADLGTEEPRLGRAGLGIDFLQDRWRVQTELHRTNTGPWRNGLALDTSYRAGDNWRLNAQLDSNSTDVPWRARQAGIGGRLVQGSVGYVVNESRNFDLQARQLRLSDANRSRSVLAAWRERWISGPRLILETRAAAEAGRNSRSDRPYFSPAHDSTLAAAAKGQWLTWKNGARQLVQIVEAGVGSYKQAGFGAAGTSQLSYAHEWRWDLGYSVRYGISTSVHPYDGVRERRRDLFLQLSVPLP